MSRAGNRKPKISTKSSILLLSTVGALACSVPSSSAPLQSSISKDSYGQQLESLKASIDTEREELIDSGLHVQSASSVAVLSSGKGSVPDIPISRLSFTKASITPALSMLLKDTSVRVTVIGGEDRYGTISAKDIAGRLPEILDSLSNTMGFFYTFSNDTLIVSSEQSFSVNYPTNADEAALAELTETCTRLGARFLKKDTAGQVLVFSAPKKAFLRVSRALAAPGSGSSVALESVPTPPVAPRSSVIDSANHLKELEDKLKSKEAIVAALAPKNSVVATPAAQKEQAVVFAEKVASLSKPAFAPIASDIAKVKDGVEPESIATIVAAAIPAGGGHATPIVEIAPDVVQAAQTKIATTVANPAPAPPVIAAPVVPASPVWQVTPADRSVRALLNRWSKEANYQLIWDVPVDLELGATATIAGTFETALQSILASLTNSDYPIEAMVYENRVVRIVKYAKGAR